MERKVQEGNVKTRQYTENYSIAKISFLYDFAFFMTQRKANCSIFLTALATLIYEILLTRIFSVTMGYHFAFMAVSIAMFGMTAGALIVYFFPVYYSAENISRRLMQSSFLFSVTIIASFFYHLYVPFIHSLSVTGFLVIATTYTLISVPFIFSGIIISLILTKVKINLNTVYAFDLIGAAAGCIAVLFLINSAGGPTSVIITAVIPAITSMLFIENKKSTKLLLILYALSLSCFGVIHAVMVNNQEPLIRLQWIRAEYSPKPLYEKWNSFTRVSIDGDSNKYDVPFGWGLSDTYDRSKKIRQLMLNIDAHSTTVISAFDGDTSKLSHLKYDVSNIAHYLRKGDVLVIGSGGGRDILTSLAFGQKSVTGIEINKDMISALNNNFGNFSGHLDKYPNVKFIGDEARSYITRMNNTFDIIQFSVIDNWFATSSGAFVFTENALYTTESWKLFFSKLKPDGIFTITRFYVNKPPELYKLTAIATESLKELGINNAREHIAVVECKQKEREGDNAITATILVSKSKLSDKELNFIDSVSNRMKFKVVFSPKVCLDSNYYNVTLPDERAEVFIKNFPLDISPPTDDRPFFFSLLRFEDILNKSLWQYWNVGFNVKAIFIMLSLLITMIVLTALCFLLPMKMKHIKLGNSKPLFLFFASIGLGFMLIEISQIQRLGIYLGHPSYSLSTSLFTLLIATGLGSYFSGKLKSFNKTQLIVLLGVLFLFGIITPHIIEKTRELETFYRIIIAAAVLFPAGFVMGTAFPMGMNRASLNFSEMMPWLWGINGVCSVLASVLAIAIAMSYGISAAFWTGFGCYVIAVLSYWREINVVEK